MSRKPLTLVLAFGLLLLAVGVCLRGCDPGEEPPPYGSMGAEDDDGTARQPVGSQGQRGSSGSGEGTGVRTKLAEGRSGGTRPLRLRLRCKTLGDNVRAAWQHMGLAVHMADPDGAPIAVCKAPWLPWDVRVPVEVQQLHLTATGYERQQLNLSDSLGTVTLVPDATVQVRAVNLPPKVNTRYRIRARLSMDDGSSNKGVQQPYVVHGRDQEPNHGQIVARFRVPSGLRCSFLLSRSKTGPDDTSGFLDVESEAVTLSPGERRTLTIDLRKTGSLSGRVGSLPAWVLEGQTVLVQAEPTGNEASTTVPTTTIPTTSIRLDSRGEFRIFGLQQHRVTLRLRLPHRIQPRLREVGTGRSQWQGKTRFLVLEPEVAVYGMVPVQGGQRLAQPFAVTFAAPPHKVRSGPVPLFTKELLQGRTLFFLVETIGHFRRKAAELRAGADRIYRIEVPQPGGLLLVVLENAPKQGVHLAVVKKNSAIAGKRQDDTWRFDGLRPGDYQLMLSHNVPAKRRFLQAGRVMAKTATVRSGKETRLTLRMPEVLQIQGVVSDWNDIPAWLLPNRIRIQHAGYAHTARVDFAGEFRLAVLGPWEGTTSVKFSGRQLLRDIDSSKVVWRPGPKELVVGFPARIPARWFRVRPLARGRVWAQIYPARRDPTSVSWLQAQGGLHLTPEPDGRFRVMDLTGGVDILVCEQVNRAGERLLIHHGWFRLRGGEAGEPTFSSRGRFVNVQTARKQQRATLSIKPPRWWQHPDYSKASWRLDGTTPQRIWLPAEAGGMVVDKKRLIPMAEIGEKLVVDS